MDDDTDEFVVYTCDGFRLVKKETRNNKPVYTVQALLKPFALRGRFRTISCTVGVRVSELESASPYLPYDQLRGYAIVGSGHVLYDLLPNMPKHARLRAPRCNHSGPAQETEGKKHKRVCLMCGIARHASGHRPKNGLVPLSHICKTSLNNVLDVSGLARVWRLSAYTYALQSQDFVHRVAMGHLAPYHEIETENLYTQIEWQYDLDSLHRFTRIFGCELSERITPADNELVQLCMNVPGTVFSVYAVSNHTRLVVRTNLYRVYCKLQYTTALQTEQTVHVNSDEELQTAAATGRVVECIVKSHAVTLEEMERAIDTGRVRLKLACRHSACIIFRENTLVCDASYVCGVEV